MTLKSRGTDYEAFTLKRSLPAFYIFAAGFSQQPFTMCRARENGTWKEAYGRRDF